MCRRPASVPGQPPPVPANSGPRPAPANSARRNVCRTSGIAPASGQTSSAANPGPCDAADTMPCTCSAGTGVRTVPNSTPSPRTQALPQHPFLAWVLVVGCSSTRFLSSIAARILRQGPASRVYHRSSEEPAAHVAQGPRYPIGCSFPPLRYPVSSLHPFAPSISGASGSGPRSGNVRARH